MIAYKLFRVLKNGEIASLFINKRERYKIGEWMDARNIPTKGYSPRFGWHSCNKPIAPHLSVKGRAWFKVSILNYVSIKRPKSQGGKWYLSSKIKILNRN
jgi:hypothetical protein